MFDISNAAKGKLHRSLLAMNKQNKCYRLVPVDETSLELELSEPALGDTTIEHDGITVLALPKELIAFVQHRNLDVDSRGNLWFS